MPNALVKSKLSLFILFLTLSVSSQATIKPQVGLGFSDNVNYEQTNKDSDFFMSARLLTKHKSDRWTALSRLQYRDYLQQNSNDTFQWRVALAKILSEKEVREHKEEVRSEKHAEKQEKRSDRRAERAEKHKGKSR